MPVIRHALTHLMSIFPKVTLAKGVLTSQSLDDPRLGVLLPTVACLVFETLVVSLTLAVSQALISYVPLVLKHAIWGLFRCSYSLPTSFMLYSPLS